MDNSAFVRFSIENFAENLAAARHATGLSQRALGKAIGVSGAMIAGAELGKHAFTLDNLCRLADALDVSIDYLAGRTDDPVLHKLPNNGN